MATILVIDDDEEYRQFLEGYLPLLGFERLSAECGEDGLRLSHSARPDLILLDWCLKKGLSGEKTLRLIKSSPATQDIPVVVISGLRDTPEDDMRARRAGAAQFMVKWEISDSVKDKTVLLRRFRSLILEHGVEAARKRAGAVRAHRTNHSGGRILLVDDDPDIREMLSVALRDKGYTVLTADTGAQGLLRARQDSPDLVVLDLGLPDMDGLALSSQLKAWHETRVTPILVLTGQSSHEMQFLAAEHSADHYLTKPIEDMDEFQDWVSALLRRQEHLPVSKDVLRVGDILIIDASAHTVRVGERLITRMPTTLFRLLCELMRRQGQLLPREYLLLRIWNGASRARNVDTAITRLKQYLGNPVKDWILCVPNVGYRLVPFGES